MAEQAKKIDINNVELSDLDNKYVAFRGINSSGDAYLNTSDGYHMIFVLIDNKAYEVKVEPDGKVYRDDNPVVLLGDVQVPALDDKGNPVLDEDGFPTVKTVDGVQYNALRDIQNPYDLNIELQSTPIVGTDDHAKAVAFIQALKLYVQSLNRFAFEYNLGTEAFLLDHLHDVEEELPLVSTYGKETTTTSTTTSSTTTSTTTTTTVKK